MGGSGSGNWYRWSKKDTVDGCRSVDIRRWHREGLLRPGTSSSWAWLDEDGQKKAEIRMCVMLGMVKLVYRCRSTGESEWQDVEESVPLDWTCCNYGGIRPWFVCPGVVNGHHCGRRVAILYLAGRYFLCRHCYRLAYESQREHRASRLVRKAQKIRRRLGGEPGFIHPFPAKPKGMHWHTYQRLRAEAELAEDYSWIAAAERFGLLPKELRK
ncbi:hypothetical protein MYX82_08705 [Acidobacteria bacterium AH-259-D05]|nr:hypothetical protein [Acidobacteria bacterium AH-259-D05]